MPAKRRALGEGSIYQRADGMWIGSVELNPGPDGKRRRKNVSSTKYAVVVNRLRELRKEVRDAGRDVESGSITVADWLDTWLDTVAAARIRPRTLATYRGYVERYIKPTIGKRRLDQVTPAHVRAMHAHIVDKGLSSTTARQAHAILVKALSDARREGYTTRDIGDLVDPPRKAASTRGALTVDQAVQVLRTAADDPLGSRWAAALLLGARQGECLGLEWDRVDLNVGTVDLAWQLQRITYRHGCELTPTGWACGRKRAGSCPQRELDVPPGFEYREAYDGLVLTRPKSRAGQRLVPLFESMRAMLAAYQADTGGHRAGLVWRRDDGRPIDPKDDSAAWHALLAEAGVPDVPLHAARHTTATLLRRGGVDLPTIGAIMGHSSAAATSGYLHLDLTLSRAAIDMLGQTLAITAAPAAADDD